MDPELDEPITALGFVRSLMVSPGGNVKVHLRLPTSFCSPNFAYLMASDAKDVLSEAGLDAPGGGRARRPPRLGDHQRRPGCGRGYRGTFGHEAEESLDELRETFRRKAHTAAMERCLTALLRADPQRVESSLGDVRLDELPDDATTEALLRRRRALGLSTAPDALVMVDHLGGGYAPDDVPLALRRARSTRISIDGNAHFCRGLLRTRYGDSDDTTFIPLNTLMTEEGALQ